MSRITRSGDQYFVHKKYLQNSAVLLVAIILSLVTVKVTADHLPPQSVLRIGGAEYESGIYRNAVGLARVYHKESVAARANDNHEHRFGVAMSSAGSIANLRDLAGGRLEFGYATAYLADDVFLNPARHGLDQSVSRLRLVASMQRSVVHILTLNNTNIDAIEHLNGKRVSFGMPDAGNWQTINPLLQLHGIEAETLKAFHFPFSLAVKKLAAGELDAVVSIDQLPHSMMTDLIASNEYKLLNFNEQIVTDFLQSRQDEKFALLKESPYRQIESPFIGVSLETVLMSQDTVSPAIVGPVLEHLLTLAVDGTSTLPKQKPWQTIKLHGIKSSIPMHDACSLIELQPQGLSAKITGSAETPNSAVLVESAEH